MEKNSVESSLKRFLKRKVKITLGVIVSFMIMGANAFSNDNNAEIFDEIKLTEKGKKIIGSETEEKDIKITKQDGTGIYINYGHNEGYGPLEDLAHIDINTKGKVIIGEKDNEVNSGIKVNSAWGKIDIKTGEMDIHTNGTDFAIGVGASGRINIEADRNINIFNENSDVAWSGNLGYIGNFNESTGSIKDTLNQVSGIRKSEINIEAKGNITLKGIENSEMNYGNVGIFAAGIRKESYVTNGDEERNKPFVDKDGYVMSEDNITTLKADNIDFLIENTHANAIGIHVQGSDKVKVNLESINNTNLIVKSEKEMAVGLSLADGNINLSSSNGDNIIRAEVEDNSKAGIGIFSESKNDNEKFPYDCQNRVNIFAENNNEIFGTSTGIYSIGQDTIINIKNNNGINKISSERGTTIEVVDNSETNLVSTNGNNYIEHEKNSKTSDENNAIKIETGGNLLLSAGGTNTVIGDISVKNKDSLLKVETSKNQFTGDILTEDQGKVLVNFDGDNSNFTGALSLGEKSDGVVELGVTNNGRWNNTNHSSVTNLELNNGIIDLAYTNDNQDISIKNITGENGTFIMDISTEDLNHTEGKTDFINIENADKTQTHFVQIGENSINGLANHDFGDKNSDEAIWIADADENITFEGKEFESVKNVFDYTLELDSNLENNNTSANGNNWYVTGVKKSDSDVTNMIEDNLSYLYNAGLSRLELDTLHKRMGEIRNYENAHGVWFRTSAGKMKSDVSDSSFKNDYYMLQVGYDTKTVEENGDYFTGIAVSRRESDIDYSNGSGDGEDIGVALYRSYAKNDGTYIDLVGRYTYIDTEYNVNSMKADYDTWAGGLSLEYGKKYRDKSEKWYVTPHAQLSYTYIDGADYKTSSGVKVEQDDIDSLIGRVGIYAGKDFEKSSHYIKASFLHEFMGDYGANITGADARIHRDLSGADSWAEVGIGGNFKVGKSGTTHIYYDIERTLGSDFETQWQGTLGIRISF